MARDSPEDPVEGDTSPPDVSGQLVSAQGHLGAPDSTPALCVPVGAFAAVRPHLRCFPIGV